MSSFISIYTLKKLKLILDNYKKNILKDFYSHFLNENLKNNLSYNEFENMVLENVVKCQIKKNYNKCIAIVHNKHGVSQCNNGQTCGLVCAKHKNNLFYGTINN